MSQRIEEVLGDEARDLLDHQCGTIGVTIQADIIKQKLPENNGGYNALKDFGKTHKKVYDELTTDHPIDLVQDVYLDDGIGVA